jgi:hypothetical protein
MGYSTSFRSGAGADRLGRQIKTRGSPCRFGPRISGPAVCGDACGVGRPAFHPRPSPRPHVPVEKTTHDSSFPRGHGEVLPCIRRSGTSPPTKESNDRRPPALSSVCRGARRPADRTPQQAAAPTVGSAPRSRWRRSTPRDSACPSGRPAAGKLALRHPRHRRAQGDQSFSPGRVQMLCVFPGQVGSWVSPSIGGLSGGKRTRCWPGRLRLPYCEELRLWLGRWVAREGL